MILRFIAIAAWVLAAVYTNLIEPSLQPIDFQNLLDGRQTVTVTANVIDLPKEETGFAGLARFSSKIEVISAGPMSSRVGSLSGGAQVQTLKVGSIVKAVISVRPAFRNDDDYSSSLKKIIEVKQTEEVSPLADMRKSFLANLSGISVDSSALVAALTIGDDSGLSPEALTNLKIVSLTHLSAVSGTNCAIVLAGAALLLNLLPIRRSIRLALSFGVIFAYLGLVGPEPSVLRASVMVGVVLLGYLVGRRVPPLEALSLAAVVLLIYEPSLSMDFGFALSALATFGLLVLAPKLAQVLEKRMPSWLAIVLSVSLAAQIACLPVLLILQPTIPIYSIFANVIAEPMVAPITVVGLVACLTSPFLPWVASALCHAASYPAELILYVAKRLASAPSASISWVEGTLGIALATFLVFCLWIYLSARNTNLKKCAGALIAVILLSLFAQSSSLALKRGNFYEGNYSIINCDVGQGDALVIRSAGQVAVVDVGREEPAIDECLSALGISKIDLLVLTHYDLDHVGGVRGAISGREVISALVTPFKDDRPGANIAQDILEARGINMVQVEKGMTGHLGEYKWLVLSPSRGAVDAEDSNDASTSMYWESDKVAMFTLADSGEKAQLRMGSDYRELFESGFGSRIVVVKIAHHGSADHAPELYEALQAEIALISVGRDNSYGHPTKRTLDTLALTGTQVLRTDIMGAIGLTETNTGLEVSIAGRS